MTPIKHPLQDAFDGYAANLKNPNIAGERVISIGRAAGLAWDMGQEKVAQTIFNEVPLLAGMPRLAQFRAGYEAHKDAFAEFATGSVAYPTAPGTPFLNAAGSYARALHYAAIAKERAGGDSVEHWAGMHGANALLKAGFPKQAAQITHAIESGVALAAVKTPTMPR